jgi:hypothetical protein
MEIRVVSSLTDEDEVRVAPMLLGELAQLLAKMPIAYDIRIQTTGDRVFCYSHTSLAGAGEKVVRPAN